jgi:DNA-binding NarL/FixJ family response regulator
MGHRRVAHQPGQNVDKQGIADCLEGFARIASGQGNAEGAARLYAVTQVLRQRIGVSQVSVERAECERDVEATRAQLGEAVFEAAWTEGGAMTLEQAIACASAEPEMRRKEEALAPSHTPLQATKEQFDGLTPRERQVAALVAHGKSNREIGDTLVISERTVAAHVSSILSKLEFTSCTQIATWAIEKGLVAPSTNQPLSER